MAELQLRDLTPAFGTEITGLDPLAALADAGTTQRLRELFDSRGVLVFRDVDIDADTQANLIRALIGMGPLAAGESGSARANGDPFYVSNKEPSGGAPFGRLLFHSDMMWSEHTFQVLSLYGVEVEPPVSPTLFASAADAWATLPPELQAEAERHAAIQGHNEHERARAANDPDVLITTFDNLPTRTTPIKYPHPRTGAPILYVSQQMTCAVEGLAPSDSEALLEKLFAHLYRAESVYEHDWRHHDLVAWDNIAVQHARHNVTVEGPVRTLRKVFAPPPATRREPRPTEVRNRGLTSRRTTTAASSPRRGAGARSAGRGNARLRRRCRCPRARGRTPHARGSRAPGRGRPGG